MINLAKGYKIYEPERLNEEYEVTDDVTLMANVGVEKIKEVFQHFIVMHDEPLFFILELPVTCDRENPVAPGILEETHKDVYYMHEYFQVSGVSKSRLTDNIEKRIIIIRGGISHTNACVGGVDNGSNERLCCPSG